VSNGHPAPPEAVGRTCPYCRVALEEGAIVVFCTSCGAVHHDDCWDENDGCAVALCEGGPSLRPDDEGDDAESPTVAEPPTVVIQPPPPPVVPAPPAPVAAAPPAPAAPTPPAAAPPSPPPPPAPELPGPGPGRSRRNLIPLIAIGIVLLGGGAAGAIVLGGSHGSSSTTVETAAAPVSDSELSASEEEPFEGEEEELKAAEEHEAEEELEPELSPSQRAHRQVQQALRNHFNNLANGYYDAAYRDLTPTEGEEIGGESSWVTAQEEDELEGFDLQVNTALFDSNAARARIVEFQTRSRATGCKEWSGYWEMSKVYGEWLISEAKLEDESC
jgi:RING finger family protein